MTPSRKGKFDVKNFLANIGTGREIVHFVGKDRIYAQGARADSLFYVLNGKVRLTVVSKTGRVASIAMLHDGDFFGEGVLAGQSQRTSSAQAMRDCDLVRIEKDAMTLALQREAGLAEMFVAHLLSRSIRYEEDLVDQLFNYSEKRLARILLLLARFDEEGVPDTVVPTISQETLAEMVGTTRSRISFFMNGFRKLGFIDYQGRDVLKIHRSLLNVVLNEQPERL